MVRNQLKKIKCQNYAPAAITDGDLTVFFLSLNYKKKKNLIANSVCHVAHVNTIHVYKVKIHNDAT